jgi:type 1 fimbria pilin
MRNVLYRIGVSLLVLTGFWCQSGWAENCEPTATQMTINTQNIKYLPTLPNNTQMTSSIADKGDGIHFECDLQAPLAGRKRIIYQQSDKFGAGVSINGHHVFATKISGIGYSLGFQCAGGPIRYIDGNNAPNGSESATVCDSADLPDMLTQREIIVKAFVTFYKTGEVMLVSGNHANIDAQPQVGMLYIEQAGSGTRTPVVLDLSALNVDIGSNGSCQVSTSDINVNLGNLSKTAFRGKSLTAGTAQSFDIPVSCASPSDVRIGFFGVTANSSAGDTLALTQESNAAGGVGVKLSYGNNAPPAPSAGTAVQINASSSLPVLKRVTARNTGSVENINFMAQYVQTEDTVSVGTANSMATFVLIYN